MMPEFESCGVQYFFPKPRRRFACTVDGDCMAPKYHNGDLVVFDVGAVEREGIVDGANYFIHFSTGENTFKRVHLDPQFPELLILTCWNDKYPARVIERAKVKFLARAVYKIVPDEAGKEDHHAK